MSLSNCPHCTSPVPAAFASMPVCTICGGDLNATSSGPIWASIDIKTDNTRTCPSCGISVKSILALECPSCQSDLAPAGRIVKDIEKENADFESAISSSNQAKVAVKQEIKPEVKHEVKQTEIKNKQKSKTDPDLRSNTSNSEIKPYPERDKSKENKNKEDFVSIKSKKKKKEGFLLRLLRMLGLKKD
ncbi:MAG: hypothetical protein H7263_04430 [Candidatus Sericytochromatia bacterium]|nr:hypothetical protein [Candidatus Sericytochromatia bacterium]